MNMDLRARVEHLGQTGLKIEINNLRILVDPYLSNSVEEMESTKIRRQIPIPYELNELTNVNWILITHEHLDHCDPHTLPILAEVNPEAIFVGPHAVRKLLRSWY